MRTAPTEYTGNTSLIQTSVLASKLLDVCSLTSKLTGPQESFSIDGSVAVCTVVVMAAVANVANSGADSSFWVIWSADAAIFVWLILVNYLIWEEKFTYTVLFCGYCISSPNCPLHMDFL